MWSASRQAVERSQPTSKRSGQTEEARAVVFESLLSVARRTGPETKTKNKSQEKQAREKKGRSVAAIILFFFSQVPVQVQGWSCGTRPGSLGAPKGPSSPLRGSISDSALLHSSYLQLQLMELGCSYFPLPIPHCRHGCQEQVIVEGMACRCCLFPRPFV